MILGTENHSRHKRMVATNQNRRETKNREAKIKKLRVEKPRIVATNHHVEESKANVVIVKIQNRVLKTRRK